MSEPSSKKDIFILKNISREGPGILEEILFEYNISSEIIDLTEVLNFPFAQDFKALIVLGGPDSANDNTKKMQSELSVIRSVLNDNIPYLGICLGLQTLVKAAGGKVVKSPVKEVGFSDPLGNNLTIDLTEAGKKDPLFKGLNDSLKVFHLHGETVELTDKMTLLAEGKFCKNQIVKVGSNAYGIQCHFELTDEMFEQWINEDPDLLKLDKNLLKNNFYSIRDEYSKTGRQLLINFLKIAGLIVKSESS